MIQHYVINQISWASIYITNAIPARTYFHKYLPQAGSGEDSEHSWSRERLTIARRCNFLSHARHHPRISDCGSGG